MIYLYNPPYWLERYIPPMTEAVISENKNSPKISTSVSETVKPPQENNSSLSDTSYSPENLKRFLKEQSALYGIKYEEIAKVIEKESHFNPNAIGDDGKSVGIAQFTLSTWRENCSPKDERLNPYKSIECMSSMFKRGMQNRWTAWRMMQ